jgi:hypothetical protein
MPGLFTKKLLTSQQLVDDTENTRLLQAKNSNPKNDVISLGAAMRNEKVENACSVATAARQRRQPQQPTAADPPCTMQDALVERLETKLLANEKECTELRKLTEARKRGIPVSLSSLDLGCDPEKYSCLGDNYLLKKLEAFVLMKVEECTKVRKLLAEASKRGISRSPSSMMNCVSPVKRSQAPRPILKRQPSSRSMKSVTWGAIAA